VGALEVGKLDNLQVLELPYAGNELSMIVLLPKKADGIGDIQNALTTENLQKWTGKPGKTKVQVFLPKFKVASQHDLKDNLTGMGMTDAFDSGKADFSGMDGRKNWLYIACIMHKAVVEVNEEGTEAAAATAMPVAAAAIASPASVPTFSADHPFIFLIRDNRSGSLLFIGKFANPRE